MFTVISDLYLFTCHLNDYKKSLTLINLLAWEIISCHVTVFSC